MSDYLAVLEKAKDGSWSAYVPDLPGCTSAGKTRDEVAKNVRDAIELYLEEIRSEGKAAPSPSSLPEMVHIGG